MRVFVALYPPPDVAASWTEAARALPLIPAHRVVLAEQLHVTLAFVPRLRESGVDELLESVERACAGLAALNLTFESVGSLPETGQTRLVAAKARPDGATLELHGRLQRRLLPGRGAAERFVPHVTLLRFASPVTWRGEVAIEPPQVVRVGDVRVVESTLSASGARHVVLRRIVLGGG